jgi:D-alanine transfer protein
MNKVLINILALILVFGIIFILLIFNKESVISNIYPSIVKINKKSTLEKDLESGKIVIFGSSELSHGNDKFIPQNYFNKDLKIPLAVYGSGGHQSFSILSRIASLKNKKIENNARIVVFLSPGWFYAGYSRGTHIDKYLEDIDSNMLYKLYFKSNTSEYYKRLISGYIKSQSKYITKPTNIYKYAFKYNDIINNNQFDKFIFNYLFKDTLISNIKYINYNDYVNNIINMNFDQLKNEAMRLEQMKVSNNNFGINDEYYTKYVLPRIKKGEIPIDVETPPDHHINQEYKDFVYLVSMIKTFKHKPLFIMQDFNPYIYKINRNSFDRILDSIRIVLANNDLDYYNMWSYKQEDYEMGTLTDIMHTGELGWVKINQKIIEHFIIKTEGKK